MSKFRFQHLSVLEKKKAPWGYVFLLPWLIIFLAFQKVFVKGATVGAVNG